MSLPDLLGLAAGTAFASGLNLYATVATLGLFHRFGIFTLPPDLQVLADPLVLGVALTLFVVEFVADKVPFVDTIWDTIHTFVRPPAAVLLAYGALGGLPAPWRIVAGLVGGTFALTAHSAKASTRVAANTSPEPFSNWLLSLTEDALVVGLMWLVTAHPLLTLAVTLALVALSLALVLKLIWLGRRFARGGPRAGGPAVQRQSARS